MRIQATVEQINRDVNSGPKPVRTSIALGKKPSPLGSASDSNSKESKVFLMLCTPANRAGVKFDVCANISRVFDKFVDQGKCTIQFVKPPKNIVISKADPLQLRALLNLLKRVLLAKNNEELDKISLTSAALVPATLAQVTKPKEKLQILQKKDYPITKSFPSTLEELKVNGINLKRVDGRMLKLSKLVVLDLKENSLPDLPESMASLKLLKELHLSKNKLTKISVVFLQSLPKTLCLLDLSHNSINMIPYVLGNLVNLVTLNLGSNKLRRLPATMGNLKSLKRLELAGNEELDVIPGSLVRLRLDHLTMSSKCLTSEVNGQTIKDSSNNIPSLTDLCLLRCSHEGFRSKVDQVCLPLRLLEYWDTMQRCPCGNFCPWTSSVRGLVMTNPSRISQTFVTDGSAGGSSQFLRCETMFCSPKCIEWFKNQPLNFR